MKKLLWCETAIHLRDVLASFGWRLERIGPDHPAYGGWGKCYLLWRSQGRHDFVAWHDLKGRSLWRVQEFAFCLHIVAENPSYNVMSLLEAAGHADDYR